MLPEIIQLLRVQDCDQRIRQVQKDLKDIPSQESRARAQLAGDQMAVEKAHHEVQALELAIKSIELDVGTRRVSIKRLLDQQFETRKNDEFRAMGNEIERYEKEVRVLEDRELEEMLKLEAAKEQYAHAQAKLAATTALVDEDLKKLAERAVTMEGRLTDLERERSELVAPVPEEAFSLYDRIFKKKGDSAVVPLAGEMCGGCHMKVVIGTVQKLRQDETLTQCESCGRLLYLLE